jgi:hypothetical protein
MENLKKLAAQLRCGLYVDYGADLEAAFAAANVLATSSKEPAAVYTALFGVVNTLCNVIEQEANNVRGETWECCCQGKSVTAVEVEGE